MSDVKTRLREIVGPNVAKFARMIGEHRQTIDNYLLGRMPRGEFLRKLVEKADININWLLTGKRPKGLSATFEKEAGVLYESDATINIITNGKYKKLLQNQCSGKAYVFIPIISEAIAAGDPLIIKEKDIEGFAYVYQKWVKRGHIYRCLRVRGNSMHPIISDDFIVAIDLTENAPLKLESQIVASRYQDGVVIKYLLLTERDYILTPHNIAEYKPISIARTAPNPIIGKVAWWGGKQK